MFHVTGVLTGSDPGQPQNLLKLQTEDTQEPPGKLISHLRTQAPPSGILTQQIVGAAHESSPASSSESNAGVFT